MTDTHLLDHIVYLRYGGACHAGARYGGDPDRPLWCETMCGKTQHESSRIFRFLHKDEISCRTCRKALGLPNPVWPTP